ncbi:GNAT family N-acetyltransferase [Paenibacillus athensensis]|uniref:GNAT family N-acetyltransferase n=1 Tax=Paenibacillus athensensis TaxID=1967502 RepID=A0A4Y8Q8W1_9BACL|nr:GNAT family N-acetyltransferase [Paenibacillus athensensis]MCD1260112.1 GNAT family N-acetyltransferase [Paenibacillus athensensis]
MDIQRLTPDMKKSVLALYTEVARRLRADGIEQWDWMYPNRFVIGSDLKSGTLYGVVENGVVIAAVVVDRKMSGAYSKLEWADRSGRPACIHRLAVHPQHQGKGLGKLLLGFAEQRARSEGCTSIRLDVFSENETALGMYSRAGYKPTGTVRFPLRKAPFRCFEKAL